MPRRLSTPLQIKHAKRRFEELNPDAWAHGAGDQIDWEAIVSGKETFSENVKAFQGESPGTWEEKKDPYEAYILQDVREKATDLGFSLVKARRLGTLQSKERKLDKTLKLLKRREEELDKLLKSFSPKTTKGKKKTKRKPQKTRGRGKADTPLPQPPPIIEPVKIKKKRKVKPTPKPKPKPKPKKTKVKKPKIFKGDYGGRYYLKRITGSRKMRRVYVKKKKKKKK